MTWYLLFALALVTIASRTVPMALLPAPRGGFAEILDALPAPLFASLAALALAGDGAFPPLPVLVAAGAAVVGAARRSLILTLACGLAGFFIGQLIGQVMA